MNIKVNNLLKSLQVLVNNGVDTTSESFCNGLGEAGQVMWYDECDALRFNDYSFVEEDVRDLAKEAVEYFCSVADLDI